jgi:murein DD-endopeptidase MepM/ murein hydrolase activator NlpD
VTSRRAPKRRAESTRASRSVPESGHRVARSTGGKRAYRHRSHAAPSQKRSLPALSMPLAAGAVALIVAGVGAITVGSAAEPGSDGQEYAALSGEYSASGSLTSRDPNVDAFDLSRDADRQLLEEQAEQQAQQRKAALQQLAARTEQRAKTLKDTLWVLPLAGYRLTATFGETSSLWSSVHTGLDFAADTGTPLVAIAHGTVTDAGYEGAYGNRTVFTLDDGTEIWYCHQNSIDVSVGQTVDPGEHVGTVGYTGNVTGPHLHLEVHPEGGEAVDPYTALQDHGVTP